ncbi:hypothetical protein, conserved [Eimeria acervulina]|uniref:Cytochrome b561 domain-containing protein n=1 Tax=Eimeria acervulina TaxID=5801 RepID=U6GVW3_EIMAC|nr:hypothetical protein, conserved [Eimeria acervulina]CDI84320.1 hypothetical protein, conserved [Eimeria acervulina]
METGELAADSRRFFWLTQAFVVLLFGLQLSLCLQAEWGGGFAISDITSVQFFNFHPLLNILAFGVASTESLISFKALEKTVEPQPQAGLNAVGSRCDSVGAASRISQVSPVTGKCVVAAFIVGLEWRWTVKAAYLRYHKIGGLGIYSGALAAVSSGLMQKQSFLRNKSPKAPLFGSANLLANALGISVVLTLFAIIKAIFFVGVYFCRSCRCWALKVSLRTVLSTQKGPQAVCRPKMGTSDQLAQLQIPNGFAPGPPPGGRGDPA